MEPASSEALSPAAEAFAELLARREAGESIELEELCAERPDVATELRDLDAAWTRYAPAIGGPVERPGAPAGSAVDLLARVAAAGRHADERYEIHGEIAAGGMGRVLEVWDRDLGRPLAMKVLRGSAAAEPRALVRFLREAQITGRLEHPGILPVHEVGMRRSGEVFFTMPLVRGASLQDVFEHARRGTDGWTRERALGVLVKLCEAVGYAHARGVVHRDLKPANVMVGAFGETYVMDWGLARRLGDADGDTRRSGDRTLDPGGPDAPPLTLSGDVLGTPAYMPPEQAWGRLDELGPAADVYAIGAMLYQLLGGVRPYAGVDEAASPAAVLDAVKSRPPRPLRAIDAQVPPELAAICGKAMAREPAQRYRDSLELAADLGAWIEGRVVRAYESGAVAELRKWVRRNLRLAAASAAAVLALVAGLAVSTALFVRARESAADLRSELLAGDVQRGRLLGRTGDLAGAEDRLWRALFRSPSSREARWALWELYWRHPCVAAFQPHAAQVQGAAFHPAGELLATCAADGEIALWEMPTLRPLASWRQAEGGSPALAFHPSGALLASAAADGEIALWDVASRARVGALRGHRGLVTELEFVPDGSRLVSGGVDGTARTWDPGGEGCLQVLDVTEQTSSHRGIALALDPAGAGIATVSLDGALRFWDRPGAIPDADFELPLTATCAAWGPRGDLLAVGGHFSSLRLWDARARTPVRDLVSSNGTLNDLVFDRRQERLYSAGGWRIDVWDVARGARVRAFPANVPIGAIALSPDGSRLVAAPSGGGAVRIWETEPRGDVRLPGHDGYAVAAYAPGETRIATADGSGRIRLWDLSRAAPGDASPMRVIGAHDGRVLAVASTPDGRLVASGGSDRTVRVWDTADARQVAELGGYNNNSDYALALSPDGSRLAYAADRVLVRVCDPATGREERALEHPRLVLCLAFGPRGERLVTVTDRCAYFWSVATGELLSELPGARLWSPAFSPDGRRLAIGTWNREVLVYALGPGAEEPRLERRLGGHGGVVWGVAFHPDDPDLLVSTSALGHLRLWDVPSGRDLASIEPFGGDEVSKVTFAPGGLSVLVSGMHPEVHLIDLQHFDRHVAGSLPYQAARLRGESGGAALPGALDAWVDGVLARPWPRLDRRGPSVEGGRR